MIGRPTCWEHAPDDFKEAHPRPDNEQSPEENEALLYDVTQQLFKVARRAELGYKGQVIKGAVVILQFEDDAHTSFIGELKLPQIYGQCVSAMLEAFYHSKMKEVEQDIASAWGMAEKMVTHPEEH